jgi:spermidine synthase
VTDRLIASALFFVSGALGLGYQLVWVRKAALVVGASQIALATVLTSFFLGLALGSRFVARLRRSGTRSPLALYGAFELGIGVYALLFPLAFAALEAAYASLYGVASGSTAALFGLRFALLFVLFLPPTFLMGGTLPLLLDGLVARDREVGPLASALYAVNILGAVAGVLLTSYLAIPFLGMNGTSRAAGYANLAVGGLALALFRGTPPLHAPDEDARVTLPRFYLAASFVSGLAAIGYQVAWARWFALFATGDVHVTALLLAVYLSALAAGSLLLAALLRGGVAPLRVLAVAQLAVPVLVFACLDHWRWAALSFAPSEPQGSYEVDASWRFASEGLDVAFFAPLFQVALVIALPVLGIGVGLPALVAAASARAAALRAASGRLLFWNTLGGSLGGFALGYAAIPAFGLAGALRALAVLSLGLGVAALVRDARERGARMPSPMGVTAAAVALVLSLALGRGDPVRRTLESFAAGEGRVVEVVEGPVATAAVFEGAGKLTLVSGSVRHATATLGEVSSHVVQGHLPALFYPAPGAPRRVLGIALGSGQAFGALLQHPVEAMDVVDISPEIVALALRHFGAFNYDLGSDPRVRMHLDDGRHFVERAQGGSYDAVLLEPSPPTHEGMHSLYSLEFAEGIRRVLRDDGVFMQWLPLQFVTPGEARRIVATQLRVFPYTYAVRSGGSDVMLLGFKREAMPSFPRERLEERLAVLAREPRFAGRRWAPECEHDALTPEGLLSLVIAGPEALAGIAAQPYVDDVPLLAYGGPDRWLKPRYEGMQLARLSFAALPLTPYAKLAASFPGAPASLELEDERARVLTLFHLVSPVDVALAEARFQRAPAGDRKARRALRVAALHDLTGAKAASLTWLRVSLREGPRLSAPRFLDSVRVLARNRIEIEAPRLEAWLARLTPAERETPLARTLADELAQHQARDAERRSGYLFH